MDEIKSDDLQTLEGVFSRGYSITEDREPKLGKKIDALKAQVDELNVQLGDMKKSLDAIKPRG